MKNKLIEKVSVLVAFALITVPTNAQVTVGNIRKELESYKSDIFGIIDILMSIISMGGVIYVASALIGKREMSKGVIIGWVSAMAIWGMAKALIK